MGKLVTSAFKSGGGNSNSGNSERGQWRDGPSVEEAGEEEDGLDLPVDPDEGMPLIPDDERVIDVPS